MTSQPRIAWLVFAPGRPAPGTNYLASDQCKACGLIHGFTVGTRIEALFMQSRLDCPRCGMDANDDSQG